MRLHPRALWHLRSATLQSHSMLCVNRNTILATRSYAACVSTQPQSSPPQPRPRAKQARPRGRRRLCHHQAYTEAVNAIQHRDRAADAADGPNSWTSIGRGARLNTHTQFSVPVLSVPGVAVVRRHVQSAGVPHYCRQQLLSTTAVVSNTCCRQQLADSKVQSVLQAWRWEPTMD